MTDLTSDQSQTEWSNRPGFCDGFFFQFFRSIEEGNETKSFSIWFVVGAIVALGFCLLHFPNP